LRLAGGFAVFFHFPEAAEKTERGGEMIRKRLLIAAMMLMAGVATALTAAEVKMPGIALSLSRGNYAQELEEAAASNGRVREFVLPEIALSPGRPLDLAGCREIVGAMAGAALPVGRVWLRLKMFQPDATVPADGVEQAVAYSVADLVAQMDFTCSGVILEADGGCAGELARLAVSSISTALKASRDDMLVTVSGSIAVGMDRKNAAYVDRVLLNGRDEWRSVGPQLTRMGNDRPLSLLLTEMPGMDSRRDYLDAFFAFSPAPWETFIVERPQPGSLVALLKMVEGLRRHFSGNLVRIEDDSPFFKLSDAGAMLRAQMVFAEMSLNRAVILARLDGPLDEPRRLSLETPEGDSFRLTCLDPLDLPASPPQTIASPRLPWQKEYLLLVAQKSQRRDDSIDESIAVSAKAGLSLEEIVARWQRYDSRQKQMIRNYSAKAEMDMHFEPPGVGTSFDVSLHFQYFWGQDGIQYWEQTAQYLNGIKLPGKSTFPLPQLEPEQVTSQPLELKLVESYVYRLEKNESIDGRECYVLSFRPRPEMKQALYSGKIWIDGATFRKVRLLLVQNNCSGSILSNQELQHFELLAGPGGAQFNLMRRSEVEQKVLAAGREFMLERRYRFNDILINSEDFTARFQQSLKSKSPMFAETKEGLREFKTAKDGTRQVKEKVDTRLWSLVFGALYDDTANFPIPFIGASTIDYDFLKTRSQLSALLVVPLLALNLSKQVKGNITLGSDLAITAMPRNDTPYRDGAEVKEEAVNTFSGSFGLRGSWRPFKDLSLSLTSYLVYELFLAQQDTADDFVLPRKGFTSNSNLDLDYSRNGYRLTLSGSFYRRLGWKAWGWPDSVEPLQKSYGKYSASLGKRFFIGSFTRVGAEVAYFSGLHLDRFSSYQPSMLAVPKIRGVGSSAISLSSVAVLSLNLGFTIFDFIRFDTYYNFARGREYQAGSKPIDFQGMELDFGTIGPWGSYLQGRITYALAGPLERYKSRWGVYLVMFLPFKK
jgi:hypothetical protein